MLKVQQYLSSKRAKYEIKMYKLCERTLGYTHKFTVTEGTPRLYWKLLGNCVGLSGPTGGPGLPPLRGQHL